MVKFFRIALFFLLLVDAQLHAAEGGRTRGRGGLRRSAGAAGAGPRRAIAFGQNSTRVFVPTDLEPGEVAAPAPSAARVPLAVPAATAAAVPTVPPPAASATPNLDRAQARLQELLRRQAARNAAVQPPAGT